VLHQLLQVLWAIDISRRAEIGAGLYIGHYCGIFVHSDAVIGENCSLSQDVTIGIAGHGSERGVPRIGAHVYIAPGARLFGPIHVGEHARIGANAVVYKDVPAHGAVAVQCTIITPFEKAKERLAA
jgi:serine O-acetyltransferase